MIHPAHVKLVVCGELLEPAVAEKTDPIAGITVGPGARFATKAEWRIGKRQLAGRRPEGFNLRQKKVRASSRSSMDCSPKLKVLASEVHARNERFAEMRRQEEIQQRRQYELRSRIERLDRNMTAWRRAERIRTYGKAMEDRLLESGPIDPEK